MSWLVEEEAAVLDGAVVRIWDELRVGELALHQWHVVVQPPDAWRWISVYREGETPVMLLLRRLQEQDPHRDWRRDRDATLSFKVQ